MKVVRQSAQLLDRTGLTEYQGVELIGRTCYKSENLMTDESATKFVTSLAKSGHHAMLEFGFIYMRITDIIFWEWFIVNKSPFIKNMNEYVVGSFRAFYDWFAGLLKPIEDGGWTFSNDDPIEETLDLLDCISRQYPEIFSEMAKKVFDEYGENWYDEDFNPEDVTFPFELMDRDYFYASIPEIYKTNGLVKCITPHIVKFTTDRGISHELVRHRPCSFAQESTRYCNYSKYKFGNEITVIAPLFEEGSIKYEVWEEEMKHAEKTYFYLLEMGATPQEARGVLPTELKTDIWVCAFEDEWQHIINLREIGTTGAPHPKIRELISLVSPALVEASENRLVNELPKYEAKKEENNG